MGAKATPIHLLNSHTHNHDNPLYLDKEGPQHKGDEGDSTTVTNLGTFEQRTSSENYSTTELAEETKPDCKMRKSATYAN
ncbi:hypothetical protein E2542_SST14830 [Spatholobus suberectus]|nr:hypothetical protein E2542_SST14830 [Spatholobus suberectus]